MKKVSCICFLLLAAGWSSAQSNEVSYSAGATFMSDQTTTNTLTFIPPVICIVNCTVTTMTFDTAKANTGFTFAVSYARRLAGVGPVALYLELPMMGTPGHGIDGVLTLNGNPINRPTSSSLFFFTPSARVKFFSSARISPWVTVGGGWARMTMGGLRANTGALQFGGGVDFKTGVPHLGLRAEARDFWSGSASETLLEVSSTSTLHDASVTASAHHLFVGGGVVLRF